MRGGLPHIRSYHERNAYEAIVKVMDVMAKTYREHTHESPTTGIHTLGAGSEAITYLARYDDGLADDLIPLGLEHVDRIGHAEIMAAVRCRLCRSADSGRQRTGSSGLAAEVELARPCSKAP